MITDQMSQAKQLMRRQGFPSVSSMTENFGIWGQCVLCSFIVSSKQARSFCSVSAGEWEGMYKPHWHMTTPFVILRLYFVHTGQMREFVSHSVIMMLKHFSSNCKLFSYSLMIDCSVPRTQEHSPLTAKPSILLPSPLALEEHLAFSLAYCL